MKTIIYHDKTRGHADHGWLKANHTFSFSSYQDPQRMNFGLLRVLNDDYVAAGMGFGKHPHDNMEIVTIPLSGALKHSDSTGRQEVISHGEVQIMSAGKGIYHSEVNASHDEPVTLFQIWVFPKVRDIEPRYDQKVFDLEGRRNQLQTVVSPEENSGALWINQDSWFTLSDLDAGKSIEYKIHKPGNGVFVMIIEGKGDVAGNALNRRDGIGISETDSVTVTATEATQLLFIEVPMDF